MTLRWYAIRTRPHSEHLAAASLEREGFKLFFPRVRTPRLPVGYTDIALFPGYLFLQCSPERKGWLSARRFPGVSGWVRFGVAIPSVPDEVIESLARRVAMINQGGGLWTRFKPGEKVRVVSGAMDNLAEVIEEPESPQSRVKVLLEFLGRLVSTEVPWRDLRPAQGGLPFATIRRGIRRTRGKGRWIRGVNPQPVASVQHAGNGRPSGRPSL